MALRELLLVGLLLLSTSCLTAEASDEISKCRHNSASHNDANVSKIGLALWIGVRSKTL
jgi:hypothetical protein